MTRKNAKFIEQAVNDYAKVLGVPFGLLMMVYVMSWNQAEFLLLERVRQFLETNFNCKMTLNELCEKFDVLDQTDLSPELLEEE